MDVRTRIDSCCSITTGPNKLITSFGHDRMPVIVRPEDFETWLDPNSPVDRVKALLQTYPADDMAIELAPREPAPRKVKRDERAVSLFDEAA